MNFFENVKYYLSPKELMKIEKPLDTKLKTKTTEFKTDNELENVDYITTSNYFYDYHSSRDEVKNINQLIIKYRRVASLAYVQRAVRIIINEAIVDNQDGNQVYIDFNDPKEEVKDEIKEKIKLEFKTLLDLLNFDNEGRFYFKNWYIDGRLLIQIILNKKNIKDGIQGLKYMSPLYLKRVYNKRNKEYYYEYDDGKIKNDEGKDVIGKIPDDLVCYVPSGIYEFGKKIPISHLHYAIRDVNRLDTLEDHMLIYRIVRSPERRVFYIDPGNLPPKKAQEYLRKFIQQHKQKKVFDESSGYLNVKKQHPSVLEDFYLLKRQDNNTSIETIGGNFQLGDIEDLRYFSRKAANSLNVPYSRINWEDRQNNYNISPTANDITHEEMEFHNFIIYVQNNFNKLFFDLLEKQLKWKNIVSEKDWESIKRKIIFKYDSNMEFYKAKKMSNLEKSLNMMRDVTDYVGKYFSKEYIRKNVLGFNEDKWKEIEKQIAEEKKMGEEDNSDNQW